MQPLNIGIPESGNLQNGLRTEEKHYTAGHPIKNCLFNRENGFLGPRKNIFLGLEGNTFTF